MNVNVYFPFKEDKKGLSDHCTPDYLLGGTGRSSNNAPFVGLYGEHCQMPRPREYDSLG